MSRRASAKRVKQFVNPKNKRGRTKDKRATLSEANLPTRKGSEGSQEAAGGDGRA